MLVGGNEPSPLEARERFFHFSVSGEFSSIRFRNALQYSRLGFFIQIVKPVRFDSLLHNARGPLLAALAVLRRVVGKFLGGFVGNGDGKRLHSPNIARHPGGRNAQRNQGEAMASAISASTVADITLNRVRVPSRHIESTRPPHDPAHAAASGALAAAA